MINRVDALVPDRSAEIAALVETLRETQQRLVTLTAGQVDAVSDRDGRTHVLQCAREAPIQGDTRRQCAILNVLPAQIALLDSLGNIVYVNESWRRLAQASVLQGPGYGTGLNYLAVCDKAVGTEADMAHEVAAAIRAVLRDEIDTYTVEYVCHLLDETRWFVSTITPLTERSPTAAVVMHVDVTERKRAERALLDSQALLGMSGRLAHVGSWVVELPPVRVLCSDVLATMHGEPEGFAPTVEEAFAYYAPEYQSAIRAGFQDCVNHGKPFSVEAEITRPDGHRTSVCAIGEAVQDDTGAIIRVQGAMQDLSERKAAERGARQLAYTLTNVLESITDGFLTLDREWRYTFVNNEAQRMLGRTREQLINKALLNFKWVAGRAG